MNTVADLDGLPLLPLNTVLFPAGSLNLRIFEVRYLDMIGRCHKNGTPFGIVSLLKGQEVRTIDNKAPTGDAFVSEQFADVGTLAHIVKFSAPQAGLMVVRCSGGERFHIRQRTQLKHGLWVADVSHIAADAAMPIPPDLQPVSHALARLLENQSAGESVFEPLWIDQPYHFDDCAWVANRWCDLLALPAPVKQNLLQLDNPLLRLELVSDILGKLQDA